MRWDETNIHEGIVDGDDEDLSSVLDVGVADIAWDVRGRARWACCVHTVSVHGTFSDAIKPLHPALCDKLGRALTVHVSDECTY